MSVDGKNVSLPHVVNNIVIERISKYVLVYGYSGIIVLWDGQDAVYVHVPLQHRNKTCGLCGNYNGIPDDDFITYSGQRVSSVARFGNSWRMSGVVDLCPNVKEEETKKPCRKLTNKDMARVSTAFKSTTNLLFRAGSHVRRKHKHKLKKKYVSVGTTQAQAQAQHEHEHVLASYV